MSGTGGWDAIVVGSGMGGLACAAALGNLGRRVLVLEKHSMIGGLTHSFQRVHWEWEVGVHSLGDLGPGGGIARLLEWLAGGTVPMQRLDEVYDTLRFPDGFRFDCVRPGSALRAALVHAFPASALEIDAWFAALREGTDAARAALRARALPEALAPAYRLLHHRGLSRWCGRTLGEVLAETVRDPRLAAVLAAQWGEHGGAPSRGSFAAHAMVQTHYLDGAWFPAGGPRTLATRLANRVRESHGEIRAGRGAAALLVDRGAIRGVLDDTGEAHYAGMVVSDIGARDTVLRLLPPDLRGEDWAMQVMAFEPSLAHVALYLGLEGDIAAAGATTANHWTYASWNVEDALWRSPGDSPPPMSMISFPSLKDPKRGAAAPWPTAEMLCWVPWEAFRPWADSEHATRPADYLEFKQRIETRMLTEFRRLFPGLGPMIRYSESSTPLSTVAATGHSQGGIYGLAVTPQRMLSPALRPATPVPGLYLAGQDVALPGVAGALVGGVLAAGAIEHKALEQLP